MPIKASSELSLLLPFDLPTLAGGPAEHTMHIMSITLHFAFLCLSWVPSDPDWPSDKRTQTVRTGRNCSSPLCSHKSP
jgi:hypothetical protein